MYLKISEEDCTKILKNYERTTDSIKYISSEFKPISENAEGLMGEHHKLIIKYELCGNQKSHTFFVKNKPIRNKVQEEITDGLGLYKKEIFMYDVLLKQFDSLGYDTSFAAKSYHCFPDQALIMQDVTLSGFSLTERYTNLTVDHLKSALKSLAMFHAAGYAFERTKSKQLNRKFTIGEEYGKNLPEMLFVQYIDQTLFPMKWWTGCLKTLDVLIDLLPHDESYKQKFKQMLKNAEIGKCFTTETKFNKTCGHGDLWSNNMLFKYKNGVATQCCLVDFQVCRYFYPCYDVLLAIFCNTDSEFRKLHLEELYLYYHNTLSEVLNSYGYNIADICPLQDFYDSIELVKVEALMQMLLTNIIIFLPKEMVTESVKNEGETGIMQVLFDNSVLAAEAFRADEEYRKNISDELYELWDALKQKLQD